MLKKYIDYLKQNPERYWFKRKLYGWGWVPVTWEGWLVLGIAVAIIVAGSYMEERYNIPNAQVVAIALTIILIFGFGFWKGERPRWQWGPPKDEK